MASEIDICNLALARIGDEATVSGLYPPEGSAQAEHCARFYPVARNSMLEMHAWGFATQRIALPLLSNTCSEWAYCYAQPNDAINLIAILDPNAPDDYMDYSPATFPNTFDAVTQTSQQYTPQPYNAEALPDGTEVIWTNQESATLRYTSIVTDTSKFSPLFTDALAWYLASMLAGPVYKGDAGFAMSQKCMGTFQAMFSKATTSDAGQRRVIVKPAVSWIGRRA